MNIIRQEKHVFKKGESYHLDTIYTLLGLIPTDDDNPYYDQDDIGVGGKILRDNDAGEEIRILRNFSIEYKIKG